MSTGAPVRPSLATLPRELVDKILHLAAPRPLPHSTSHMLRERNRTLLSVAQTCRALSGPANALLWSCLHIVNTNGLDYLASLPDEARRQLLFEQVRAVSMDDEDTNFKAPLLQLIPCLPHLARVVVQGGMSWFKLESFAAISSLTTLQLGSVRVDRNSLHCTFPSLVSLSIAVLTFKFSGAATNFRSPFNAANFPALRAIYVWKCKHRNDNVPTLLLFYPDLFAQLDTVEIPIDRISYMDRPPVNLPTSAHLVLRVTFRVNDGSLKLLHERQKAYPGLPLPVLHFFIVCDNQATTEDCRRGLMALVCAVLEPQPPTLPASLHLPLSLDLNRDLNARFSLDVLLQTCKSRGIEVCWYEAEEEPGHAVSTTVWRYVREHQARSVEK
ncbi:hypothetical protein JCM10207_006367 [Rhodosporidiobolus poonsookiae]